MPEPRRQRNHVPRVLLVSEEETAFAEGGSAKGQCEYFTQLLHHEDFDLVPDFLGQVLEIGLVLLRQDDG